MTVGSKSIPSGQGPRHNAATMVRRACLELGHAVERIELLAGDVSQRRYFRLHSESGTGIACCYPEPFDSSEGARARRQRICSRNPPMLLHFASDPVAYIETTHWFLQCGIPVPRLFGVCGRLGVILLEDVGDLSLERATDMLGERKILAAYRRCVGYLEQLQSSTSDAVREGLVACSMRLDSDKLYDEMLLLLETVFAYFGGENLPVHVVRLQHEWRQLARRAQGESQVLCHRDYHSRNLFLENDVVFVLDHQDLRLGHPGYDLVSLVWDPYVALSPGARNTMISQMDVGGLEELRPVVVQRLLKALGTYLTVLTRRQDSCFFHAARSACMDLAALFDDEPLSKMPGTRRVIVAIGEALDCSDGATDGGRRWQDA